MNEPLGTRELVEFFRDPEVYDHHVDDVDHRQTHVSHLFFAGDYVYKVKKPVDMGFLDFSTLQKRRDAAVAELELNRRVSPDVYLDVVSVHRDRDGRLCFDAPTEVLEVAVKMRRLPESQRLSSLVESGRAEADMMADLGRLVADFHRRAETDDEIAEYGSLEIIRKNWDENFEQTEAFIGRTISRQDWETCKEAIERFMRVYADLLKRRVDGGHVRDCHGDLQTDDIFIDPETGAARVLDCIEFNKRFRYSDTLSDAAFLSMDLRYRGADDLARAFLDSYFEASRDDRMPALLKFYESYRAYVRGKVRSFVIDQPDPSEAEKETAAAEARRFFDLAVADALRTRPRLILVVGLMGSGKTTLARALAERAGARLRHSDVVRKRLADLDPESEQKEAFGEGIYSPEMTERTYEALVDEARAALADGFSVLLDASWSARRHRQLARDAAAEREAVFAIVECTAPDEVLRERLSDPDRPITDGRLELLDDQRAAYEPPSTDEADELVEADTTGPVEELADRLHDQLFETE